ncbi:MAG: GtrA family protein [Oscillospiraceae bacterium]|jgi:putative flippase GtrA|nr:GtrA family protein [Oscillospiraceae bacterium]
MSEPVKLTAKENLIQTLKYFCFAASAGAIQLISFTVLTELNIFHDSSNPYGPSYFIALVLSVLWNFTFNRKFTFKSATNIPIAMLKVFAYYLVFTPASIWWGNALTFRFSQHWMQYVVLVGTMLVNGVTEFLYQRFFVFGKSINTNESGQKEEERKREQTGKGV